MYVDVYTYTNFAEASMNQQGMCATEILHHNIFAVRAFYAHQIGALLH